MVKYNFKTTKRNILKISHFIQFSFVELMGALVEE